MSAYQITFSNNEVLKSDGKDNKLTSDSFAYSIQNTHTSASTIEIGSQHTKKKAPLQLSGFYAQPVRIQKSEDKLFLINSNGSNYNCNSQSNSPYDNRVKNQNKKSGKTLVSVFTYTPKKKYIISY